MQAWIKAIRLRTLPLAWASLSMGASLAYLQGAFRWDIYLLSLLTAFLLQIVSNLANDYGDAASGIDGAHREGPSRTIQAGLIRPEKMKRAILLTGTLAFCSGLALVFLAFADWQIILVFVCVGVLAIIAALKYTMGQNPYGYSGFGDVFVLVFFGWVGVAGATYLYDQVWLWENLLPATSLGLMAVAVLNVNNIRDIQSDRLNGKFSIPVRIGRQAAVRYHVIVLALAMICLLVFALLRDFGTWQWMFALAAPLLVKNGVGVARQTEAAKLDPYLKQMALTTLVLVLLFILGNFLARL